MLSLFPHSLSHVPFSLALSLVLYLVSCYSLATFSLSRSLCCAVSILFSLTGLILSLLPHPLSFASSSLSRHILSPTTPPYYLSHVQFSLALSLVLSLVSFSSVWPHSFPHTSSALVSQSLSHFTFSPVPTSLSHVPFTLSCQILACSLLVCHLPHLASSCLILPISLSHVPFSLSCHHLSFSLS